MVTLLLVLLLVLVVGLAVAVTVGRIGGGLPRPATDVPPPLEGPVGEPGDLDRARFQLAFRGYRMDQVDQVLDAARDALAARDREIARLRGELPDELPGDPVGTAQRPVGGPADASPGSSADGSPDSPREADPFRRPGGTPGAAGPAPASSGAVAAPADRRP